MFQDQTAYFVSSIFLRRLLQPGVYQKDALRATVMCHKKYLSDYEFQSLSVIGLKREILTAIELEVSYVFLEYECCLMDAVFVCHC